MKFFINQLSFFFIVSILLLACEADNSIWKVVYKNNKEGQVIIGEKKNLVNAIRKGASLRIGWGVQGKTHTIEHLATPIWIGVLDGEEVMAHLDPQVLSGIDWENKTASYGDSTLLNKEWRVVLTTQGAFDAVWYDRANKEVTRRSLQNHIITWFVKDIDEAAKVAPLFKEE